MPRVITIAERVKMINKEVDARRVADLEPLAEVEVWYDPPFKLGYQLRAKARLEKGYLVGFYKGEWVLTEKITFFRHDAPVADATAVARTAEAEPLLMMRKSLMMIL
ncbi:hypothetical protein B484DRAFT_401350 [Ochromonadaceae sp. CCMP2298]|nr:hypothetical protein B484DRAFT_401350 [Ochromonadaceae sp. CCMP2298]